MTASTKVQWRVQTKTKSGRWLNRGLFETRERARQQAAYMREGRMRNGDLIPNTAYGFGNTRVICYVKGN